MDYPELVTSYLNFCRIRRESREKKQINLTSEQWFYPTTLLPLGDFIQSERKSLAYIPPVNDDISNYVNLMVYPPLGELKKGKSYVSLVRLPLRDTKKGENALHGLYPRNGDWKSYGGQSTYLEIVNELVDNIYEHSNFSNGMVMAQRYDKKGFIEACVFDNGRTIAGSFKEALDIDYPGLEAIKRALNGDSTKSGKERGTGLQNTTKLVLEGMKGQIMIVSGNGLLFSNFSSAPQGYNLKADNSLSGTLVSIRFPIQRQEVRWYEIIK